MEAFFKSKCKICDAPIEIRVSLFDFGFSVCLMDAADKFKIINTANFKVAFDLYCTNCWEKKERER